MTGLKVGLFSMIVCCAAAHAFQGPSYTATIKVPHGSTLGTLTITGRGEFTGGSNLDGLIQLFGLNDSQSTGRGNNLSAPITIAVYTSNANMSTTPLPITKTGLFGGSAGDKGLQLRLTSNGNGATPLSYSVRVNSHNNSATVKSDTGRNSGNPQISIQGNSNQTRDRFTFKFTSVDFSGLPTIAQGRNTIPALGNNGGHSNGMGLSNFILVMGTDKLAIQFNGFFKKGKIVGDGTSPSPAQKLVATDPLGGATGTGSNGGR